MPRHPDADADLVRGLHQLVFKDAEFRSALAAAFERARTELENEENALPYSSAEVPPALFESKLAKDLRNKVNLCRVFILRRARRLETPEVHRNSIQRLTSYRGRGTIHSAATGGQDMDFKPYVLEDPEQSLISDLNKVWDVVPMNTWHFPEASAEGDWHTVTFHSAASEEIIDEYAPPTRREGQRTRSSRTQAATFQGGSGARRRPGSH